MASLSKRAKTGSYSIQFEDRDNVRRTIIIGKMPRREAETVKRHVEALAYAQIARTAPERETSRWVSEAGEKLIAKLAKVGLVEQRASGTLGEFIDGYTSARVSDPNIKSSTIAASEPTHKSLKEHFGTNATLRDITKGDAKSWRLKVAKGRAENTVRKWTANAKKLFNAAIEFELLETNPFDGLPSSTTEVRARDYFVTVGEAEKVLKACPSNEWKLIFGLARYGGLRCPSEVLALRWSDVLWQQGRFIVHSVKTEHHEGHETRIVPLFPELLPILEQGRKEAADGAEFVISRFRDSSTNLRTYMKRIIEKAGLTPWPKIFQNLRATRATELADKFPSHVAAAWLGHSEKVAKESYWQVTDEHFETANTGTRDTDNSKALQKALQCVQELGSVEQCTKKQKRVNPVIHAFLSILQTAIVGDEGLEPPTSSV